MKNLFLIFFLISMIFFSCKKETERVSNNLPNKQTFSSQRIFNISVIDQRLDEFSRMVAIAQKNSDFRSVLLTEAKQNVGTENAILYLSVKDIVITNQGNNLSIHQFLKAISDSLGYSYNLNYFDCQLVEDMPQLTLSLYITNDNLEINDMESWPKSIVLPETYYFDEVADFNHDAYDENLQTYSISNNVEPEDQFVLGSDPIPYFIIVTNYDAFIVTDDSYTLEDGSSIWERMGIDSVSQELIDSLDYAKTNNNEKIIIDVNACNTTNENLISYYGLRAMINRITEEDYDPIPPLPPGNCPRDEYDDREILTQFQLLNTTLKKFSKWPRRWTEIKFTMLVAVEPTNLGISDLPKQPTMRRKYIKKDKLYNFSDNSQDVTFLKWQYLEGEHGNPYKMSAIGINKRAGTTQSFDIGLSPTIKFKVNNVEISVTAAALKFSMKKTIKDADLLGDVIYYCDPISGNGYKYSSNQFDFWMKEEH